MISNKVSELSLSMPPPVQGRASGEQELSYFSFGGVFDVKLMESGINLDAAYGFSPPVSGQEDIAVLVSSDLDMSLKPSVKKVSP